jgi:inhibitor of cysteine peptidase
MKFFHNLTRIFVLILVIVCIMGSGCLGDASESTEATRDVNPVTSPSKVYLFDKSSNGETLTVVQDSLIQIRLEENATTGYMWEYRVDDGLIAFGDNEPSDHFGKFDAESGTTFLELHPSKPGTYTFNAVYKRPLDKITGDEETFVLTFIVE